MADLEIVSTSERFYEIPEALAQIFLAIAPENIRRLPKREAKAKHLGEAAQSDFFERLRKGFWVTYENERVTLYASNGRETKRYMGPPEGAVIECKIWLDGQMQVPPPEVVEHYAQLRARNIPAECEAARAAEAARKHELEEAQFREKKATEDYARYVQGDPKFV